MGQVATAICIRLYDGVHNAQQVKYCDLALLDEKFSHWLISPGPRSANAVASSAYSTSIHRSSTSSPPSAAGLKSQSWEGSALAATSRRHDYTVLAYTNAQVVVVILQEPWATQRRPPSSQRSTRRCWTA